MIKSIIPYLSNAKIGGGGAGNQLTNASTAAKQAGITGNLTLVSGDADKILDQMKSGKLR